MDEWTAIFTIAFAWHSSERGLLFWHKITRQTFLALLSTFHLLPQLSPRLVDFQQPWRRCACKNLLENDSQWVPKKRRPITKSLPLTLKKAGLSMTHAILEFKPERYCSVNQRRMGTNIIENDDNPGVVYVSSSWDSLRLNALGWAQEWGRGGGGGYRKPTRFSTRKLLNYPPLVMIYFRRRDYSSGTACVFWITRGLMGDAWFMPFVTLEVSEKKRGGGGATFLIERIQITLFKHEKRGRISFPWK